MPFTSTAIRAWRIKLGLQKNLLGRPKGSAVNIERDKGIRRKFEQDGMSYVDLAAEYDLTPTRIQQIITMSD